MIRSIRASLALVAATLAGCASSLAGLGGTENYACRAPEGVMCDSVSGVYANSIYGNLRPVQSSIAKSSPTASGVYGAASVAAGQSAASAAADDSVRSNPRVLRLWVAPWEDSDGDLHEEGYLHVIVDTGRWLIEHVRPAARSSIDGVIPPSAAAIRASPDKAPRDTETPVEPPPASPASGTSTISPPTP